MGEHRGKRGGGRIRLATVAASRDHRLTPRRGLFELQTIVLAVNSTLDLFPGGPVQRALKYPSIGVLLRGEAARATISTSFGFTGRFSLSSPFTICGTSVGVRRDPPSLRKRLR